MVLLSHLPFRLVVSCALTIVSRVLQQAPCLGTVVAYEQSCVPFDSPVTAHHVEKSILVLAGVNPGFSVGVFCPCSWCTRPLVLCRFLQYYRTGTPSSIKYSQTLSGRSWHHVDDAARPKLSQCIAALCSPSGPVVRKASTFR